MLEATAVVESIDEQDVVRSLRVSKGPAVCKLLKTTSKDLHSGGDLLSDRVSMFGLEVWFEVFARCFPVGTFFRNDGFSTNERLEWLITLEVLWQGILSFLSMVKT